MRGHFNRHTGDRRVRKGSFETVHWRAAFSQNTNPAVAHTRNHLPSMTDLDIESPEVLPCVPSVPPLCSSRPTRRRIGSQFLAGRWPWCRAVVLRAHFPLSIIAKGIGYKRTLRFFDQFQRVGREGRWGAGRRGGSGRKEACCAPCSCPCPATFGPCAKVLRTAHLRFGSSFDWSFQVKGCIALLPGVVWCYRLPQSSEQQACAQVVAFSGCARLAVWISQRQMAEEAA